MLTNCSDLHNGAAKGQTFKGIRAILNLIFMEAMLVIQNRLNPLQLQLTLVS